MLALASVLAVSFGVRAGVPPPTCSVLVSSDSNPVPAETATVYVGETGTITGSGFTPDTEIEISITVNGVPQVTFPQMTDGSGGFTFGGPVMPEQVGTLVLTATEGQVCSDSVTVTILAAPSSSASGLPNAAMEPPAPRRTSPVIAFLAVALVVAVGFAFGTTRSRPTA
jgi:hypothetical protein